MLHHIINACNIGHKKGGPVGAAPEFSANAELEDVHIIFVADKAHLGDVRLLGDRTHFIDELIPRSRVRLQVNLRNRVHLLCEIAMPATQPTADGGAGTSSSPSPRDYS